LPISGSSGSNSERIERPRPECSRDEPCWGGKSHAMKKVALVLCLGLAGCSKSYIPNTDVEDNSDNRKVIAFCEEYRHAVEEKDVGKLLKLASARYYEDGGNTNADDDMDYDGLKEYLTTTFTKTQTVRYEIRYRKVVFNENKKVFVEYSYAASFRIPGIKGEEWMHTVADNRLELIPEQDSFKILAGM
jgi:hypothetical protein